jgi:hypothetical protein
MKSPFLRQYEKQIKWLLRGDPAIQYQTHRDLLRSRPGLIESARDRISQGGWGKRLLDLQEPGGTWGGGLYSPKWTSTFYTLLLLMRLGTKIEQNIGNACLLFLDRTLYLDHGINVSVTLNHSDTCVTGMFLSILCHFQINDPRLEHLVDFLEKHQMADQGWNCEIFRGARHSSFHTTLSVLEGLWAYEKFTGSERTRKMQEEGMEFLLQHRFFRSHRTGAVVDPKMTRCSFPPRWRYDIMRAMDYARDKRIEKEERCLDAIEIIRSKQTRQGYWKLQNKHPGRVHFDMEQPGSVSRWNTLRALRILDWWEGMD